MYMGGFKVKHLLNTYHAIHLFANFPLPPSRYQSYHVQVDTRMEEPLQIHFDVSFPHIPCEILSLDAMDVGGKRQLDVADHHSTPCLENKCTLD